MVDETSWPFWAAPCYGLVCVWGGGGVPSGAREGGSTGALPRPWLLKLQVFETEPGIYSE